MYKDQDPKFLELLTAEFYQTALKGYPDIKAIDGPGCTAHGDILFVIDVGDNSQVIIRYENKRRDHLFTISARTVTEQYNRPTIEFTFSLTKEDSPLVNPHLTCGFTCYDSCPGDIEDKALGCAKMLMFRFMENIEAMVFRWQMKTPYSEGFSERTRRLMANYKNLIFSA